MSAQGVSILDTRVKFAAGQATTGTPDAGFIACGDETGELL